jgi:hypothetical protein
MPKQVMESEEFVPWKMGTHTCVLTTQGKGNIQNIEQILDKTKFVQPYHSLEGWNEM